MYQVSITRQVVTVRLCHHAASLTTIKEKEIARETKKKEEHNKDQTEKNQIRSMRRLRQHREL
jgi:hypothetical protein